jgi:hypothetical protein
MPDGYRSYGPGKFYTIVDSYVYEMTLDGGADEEESYEYGGGWYGLVWIDEATRRRIHEIAAEHGDHLTAEEDRALSKAKAVILFERSDGIVESEWFTSQRAALDAWAEIVRSMPAVED